MINAKSKKKIGKEKTLRSFRYRDERQPLIAGCLSLNYVKMLCRTSDSKRFKYNN